MDCTLEVVVLPVSYIKRSNRVRDRVGSTLDPYTQNQHVSVAS